MRYTRTIPTIAILAILVTGCMTGAQVLGTYRPAIDPENTDLAKFEVDLAACRKIATTQYDKYQEERSNQIIVGALLGAAVGAATGAVVGDIYGDSGYGASIGAVSGAAYGVGGAAWATDPKGAAARVLDRCLAARGHRILSDLGKG